MTLREKVREAYSNVATCPGGHHPFAVGRDFALSLGYQAAGLDRLPAASVEAFSGVSNLPAIAEIAPGSTVLDLGCGAGMDSWIAAERAGPDGIVFGIDFSAAMLERTRHAAASNVWFCQGDAERLPLRNASVDTVLVNGIFNLNAARAEIFRELGRVVRPGGAVYAAELVLSGPVPGSRELSESDWFA